MIQQSEDNLLVQKEMLIVAERKIKEEQRKSKS